MTTETILKPIGNWQITIPLSRRQYLGIDKKHVRARLEGDHIIIESLNTQPLDWDVKQVSLNSLNTKTKKAVQASQKNYLAWNKGAFISHGQVRNAM